MSDYSSHIQEIIRTAFIQKEPLRIVGGNTKSFYGRASRGQILNIAEHQGILDYEPSELVVTARAGTPLQELSDTLVSHGQCLGFEPPCFGEKATLGGSIACGLSGPARPYRGAARDFVLGVKCINGKGEILRFGGQVMKNVAGFDISRLMVGALGTLGVLLEISCKVFPVPKEEITLVMSIHSLEEALQQLVYWSNQTIPMSASCYDGENVFLRLSGISIQSARNKISAEVFPEGTQFWTNLREQRLAFFTQGSMPLWRLSLPLNVPSLNLSGDTLFEWGGALRWLRSDLPAKTIRDAVAQAGGHATLFRGGDRESAIFHPLPEPLERLHHRVKDAFDPQGILNPGRMAIGW